MRVDMKSSNEHPSGFVFIGGVQYSVYEAEEVSGIDVDHDRAEIRVPLHMARGVADRRILSLIVADLVESCGPEVDAAFRARLTHVLSRGLVESMQANPEFYVGMASGDEVYVVTADGSLQEMGDTDWEEPEGEDLG